MQQALYGNMSEEDARRTTHIALASDLPLLVVVWKVIRQRQGFETSMILMLDQNRAL